MRNWKFPTKNPFINSKNGAVISIGAVAGVVPKATTELFFDLIKNITNVLFLAGIANTSWWSGTEKFILESFSVSKFFHFIQESENILSSSFSTKASVFVKQKIQNVQQNAITVWHVISSAVNGLFVDIVTETSESFETGIVWIQSVNGIKNYKNLSFQFFPVWLFGNLNEQSIYHNKLLMKSEIRIWKLKFYVSSLDIPVTNQSSFFSFQFLHSWNSNLFYQLIKTFSLRSFPSTDIPALPLQSLLKHLPLEAYVPRWSLITPLSFLSKSMQQMRQKCVNKETVFRMITNSRRWQMSRFLGGWKRVEWTRNSVFSCFRRCIFGGHGGSMNSMSLGIWLLYWKEDKRKQLLCLRKGCFREKQREKQHEQYQNGNI